MLDELWVFAAPCWCGKCTWFFYLCGYP